MIWLAWFTAVACLGFAVLGYLSAQYDVLVVSALIAGGYAALAIRIGRKRSGRADTQKASEK